jgi:hypothetical protein
MTTKSTANDNQPPEYVPPTVWTPEKPSGGQFANINRPVSGATHEKELPRGQHPLQLYSAMANQRNNARYSVSSNPINVSTEST